MSDPSIELPVLQPTPPPVTGCRVAPLPTRDMRPLPMSVAECARGVGTNSTSCS